MQRIHMSWTLSRRTCSVSNVKRPMFDNPKCSGVQLTVSDRCNLSSSHIDCGFYFHFPFLNPGAYPTPVLLRVGILCTRPFGVCTMAHLREWESGSEAACDDEELAAQWEWELMDEAGVGSDLESGSSVDEDEVADDGSDRWAKSFLEVLTDLYLVD